ncbi:hypothetical protein L6R49_24680, partial [Myxococcota bacterium]|nr:hypothetical protein [Myxococcota bacterium]
MERAAVVGRWSAALDGAEAPPLPPLPPLWAEVCRRGEAALGPWSAQPPAVRRRVLLTTIHGVER